MRLETIVGLVLLAYTACALQLHHEERRDDVRSLVFPRRPFQPISRRKLGSAHTSDENKSDQRKGMDEMLRRWMYVKEHGPVTGPIRTAEDNHVRVYSTTSHILFPDVPLVIVKEVDISRSADKSAENSKSSVAGQIKELNVNKRLLGVFKTEVHSDLTYVIMIKIEGTTKTVSDY
ncbi:hypothetical protein APHAL10511_003528 [Amanita phalloides]|nr:hypothetical protein APHAL10511_003528 [Amanita phalloides]